MVDWVKEFPGKVTVCDRQGVIVLMNDQACQGYAKGADSLIGTNLLDCHPEPARSMVAELLANPRCNSYTIEKDGVKKLIYQSPWYQDGQYMGFVELSLEIPYQMPHFLRK